MTKALTFSIKIEAIKSNLKALRAKSYVATTAKDIFQNAEIKPYIMNRAKKYTTVASLPETIFKNWPRNLMIMNYSKDA
jgi:hypothetical protein